MNAPAGSSKLNVIGSSSAIVSAGPMPGQHADERPDQHPERGVQEVLRLQDGPEAVDAGSRGRPSQKIGVRPAGRDTPRNWVNAVNSPTASTIPTMTSRTSERLPSSRATRHEEQRRGERCSRAAPSAARRRPSPPSAAPASPSACRVLLAPSARPAPCRAARTCARRNAAESTISPIETISGTKRGPLTDQRLPAARSRSAARSIATGRGQQHRARHPRAREARASLRRARCPRARPSTRSFSESRNDWKSSPDL